MNPWLAYALGVITLPVGYALFVLSLYAFTPKKQASTGCNFCRAAGYRLGAHEYGYDDHLGITCWFLDFWHSHVTALRWKHRIEWQKWYDSLIPDGNLAASYAKYQKKYGTSAGVNRGQ